MYFKSASIASILVTDANDCCLHLNLNTSQNKKITEEYRFDIRKIKDVFFRIITLIVLTCFFSSFDTNSKPMSSIRRFSNHSDCPGGQFMKITCPIGNSVIPLMRGGRRATCWRPSWPFYVCFCTGVMIATKQTKNLFRWNRSFFIVGWGPIKTWIWPQICAWN